MSNHKIAPEKVTRPIQLLAAWLTGLIVTDGAFLSAAIYISSPNWAAGVLVIAAVVNVPLFLISIFLLQTKYRPEMQEDVYYSKYLEYQYVKQSVPPETPDVETQIKKVTKNILDQLGPGQEQRREPIEQILKTSQVEQIATRLGGNRSLSELYLRPHHWPAIVLKWKDSPAFQESLSGLIDDGLATMDNEDYLTCKLTSLGIQVAKNAQNNNSLFAQRDSMKIVWEREDRLTS